MGREEGGGRSCSIVSFGEKSLRAKRGFYVSFQIFSFLNFGNFRTTSKTVVDIADALSIERIGRLKTKMSIGGSLYEDLGEICTLLGVTVDRSNRTLDESRYFLAVASSIRAT